MKHFETHEYFIKKICIPTVAILLLSLFIAKNSKKSACTVNPITMEMASTLTAEK